MKNAECRKTESRPLRVVRLPAEEQKVTVASRGERWLAWAVWAVVFGGAAWVAIERIGEGLLRDAGV